MNLVSLFVPRCDYCGAKIPSWEGKVIISSWQYYSNNCVPHLNAACMECMSEIDGKPDNMEHHVIWELAWVRGSFSHLVETIAEDMSVEPSRIQWYDSAITDLSRISDRNVSTIWHMIGSRKLAPVFDEVMDCY